MTDYPAIITSHNTIIVHNQLIRFPDIAFFTSPIPLHIAAMVILYGHMSKCEILPRHAAVEDVWLALDMLPRFRWRWERKDFNGGHPLIAKLAERVMEVNLQQVGPVSHPSLLCEPEWEDDVVMSPAGKSQQSTPTLAPSPYAIGAVGGGAVVYGPQPRPMNGGALGPAQGQTTAKGAKKSTGSGGSTPSDNNNQLVDVPAQLFYPFYPETPVGVMQPPSQNGSGSSGSSGSGHPRDYSGLLAAAAAVQEGPYGYRSSQDSFVSEERDPKLTIQQHQGMQMWASTVSWVLWLLLICLLICRVLLYIASSEGIYADVYGCSAALTQYFFLFLYSVCVWLVFSF